VRSTVLLVCVISSLVGRPPRSVSAIAVLHRSSMSTPCGPSAPPDFRRQLIELAPGEKIAVSEAGAGPPIVFVPGFIGSAYGFRRVVANLPDFRSVIIDPLGLGWSGRPERADYSLAAQAVRLDSTLARLGIERALFVCHSVGAALCFRVAALDSNRVAGIVSINGGAAESAATPGLRFALRLVPILKLLRGNSAMIDRLKQGLVRSSYDASWVTADAIDGYTEPFGGQADALISTLKRMASAHEPWAITPRLTSVRPPVRLLVGAGSRTGAIPMDDVMALVHGLPALTIDSVARTGQYIQEEQPCLVSSTIRDFIRAISTL
jgi:pimeloyl-ACP methyl ester carboxylesterase